MKHRWLKDGWYCRPKLSAIGNFIGLVLEAAGMVLIMWAMILLTWAIFAP